MFAYIDKLMQNYTKCNSVVGKFRQSTGRSFSNNYFQATQIIDLVTSKSGVFLSVYLILLVKAVPSCSLPQAEVVQCTEKQR